MTFSTPLHLRPFCIRGRWEDSQYSELYFLRHKMPKNIRRFQSLNYISEYLLKSFKCSCMPSAFKDDRLCLLVCVDTGWSYELIGYVWGYIKDTNRSARNGIWTNYGWIGWNSNFTAMAPDQVRKWNFRVLSIYAKSDAQKIKGHMGEVLIYGEERHAPLISGSHHVH